MSFDKNYSSLVQVVEQLGGKPGRVDASTVTPMLAENGTERDLDRAGCTFELKLDGVRILAERDGANVRLFYRSSREVTGTYPEVVAALLEVPFDRFVIDGEIVALDGEGRPSFEQLQSRMHASPEAAKKLVHVQPAVYLVFDVLEIGGIDLRNVPLAGRREIVKVIVDDGGSVVSRLDGVDGSGRSLYEMCKEKGLEGVMAKRLDSLYLPGERSFAWCKIKLATEDDFVVVAFVAGTHSRSKLGSLEVAARLPSGELIPRGRVGSGISGPKSKELYELFMPIAVREPQLAVPARHDRTWVQPVHVARVRYTIILREGTLRHPVFVGLKER